ncbi:MAG: DUF1553 domain-containing protein, partial [Planctomycetota bacterium]
FLDDPTPGKRERLIDALLARPEHARHLAITFDVMLMERRPDKRIKTAQWRAYLWRAFRDNRPWNEIAAEILAADGTDPATRPAARFLMDRDAEPHLMTRDIGRKFFGMDLQCCQCHDHPLVDAYRQADYYGIYAFVQRTFLFTDAKKNVFLAERAEGDTGFTSAFTGEQNQTRPRLPGELALIEPVLLADEAYAVFADKNVRPVPRYSRRGKLAELVRQGTNPMFRKNIVNRLWAVMMGRGLVEPLDMIHRDNPGAAPELLEILAERFAEQGFDIRWFLRELALSKTYQRAFDVPPLSPEGLTRGTDWTKRLERAEAAVRDAQHLWEQALEAETQAEAKLEEAEAKWAGLLKPFNDANKKVADAVKQLRAAEARLKPVETQWKAKKELSELLQQAHAKAVAALAKAPDDALQKVVASLKARLDKVTGEVHSLETQRAKLAGPVQKAREALAAARKAAEPVAAQLKAAQEAILAAQPAVLAARQRRHQAERRWMEALRTQRRSAVVAEAVQALRKVAELREREKTVQSRLAELDRRIAAAQTELAAARKDVEAVEKSLADASALLTAATAELQNRRRTVEELKTAAATVRSVGTRLENDAELLEIAKRLQARVAALGAEDAELIKSVEQRKAVVAEQKKRLAQVRKLFEERTAALQTLQRSREELTRQRAELTEALQAAVADAERVRKQWPDTLAEMFAATSLTPLTPEQFTWSALAATGQLELQYPAARAAADKQVPPPKGRQRSAEEQRRWDDAFENFLYGKLSGNEATFVRLFGHGAGQPQRDFFATVDQALFFENAPTLTSWLNPAGQNLTARLVKLDDPQKIAEELFLSVFSRRPEPEEVAFVREYLQARKADKTAACRELGWALITSAEFRFRY